MLSQYPARRALSRVGTFHHVRKPASAIWRVTSFVGATCKEVEGELYVHVPVPSTKQYTSLFPSSSGLLRKITLWPVGFPSLHLYLWSGMRISVPMAT